MTILQNTVGRPKTGITHEQRNEIADLLTMNTELRAIERKTGVSCYHIRMMLERKPFQDLLARKRAAVAKALEATR